MPVIGISQPKETSKMWKRGYSLPHPGKYNLYNSETIYTISDLLFITMIGNLAYDPSKSRDASRTFPRRLY